MENRVVALGRAAGAMLLRGLRPATKAAMTGVVAAVETTGRVRGGLGALYDEAKREYRADREHDVAQALPTVREEDIGVSEKSRGQEAGKVGA